MWNKNKRKVKTHSKLLDFNCSYELLPQNLIKNYIGYTYIGIIGCDIINEHGVHTCFKGNNSAFTDYVFINNPDVFWKFKARIMENVNKRQDFILTLESTWLGYTIISVEKDENPCEY